jgi:hypothetical protein
MRFVHSCRLVLRTKLKALKVETEKSNKLYLYIDLPRFDFPIIFSELVCFLSVLYSIA